MAGSYTDEQWIGFLAEANEKGWSQGQLAKRLGKSRKTVNRAASRLADQVSRVSHLRHDGSVPGGTGENKPIGQTPVTDTMLAHSTALSGVRAAFLDALIDGDSVTKAAQRAGMSRSAASEMVNHDPVFRAERKRIERQKRADARTLRIINDQRLVEVEKAALDFIMQVINDDVPAELPRGMDPEVAEKVTLYLDPTHQLRAIAALNGLSKNIRDAVGTIEIESEEGEGNGLQLTAPGGEERLMQLLVQVPRRLLVRALELKEESPA